MNEASFNSFPKSQALQNVRPDLDQALRSCSTQLSMKFILLINVKMPTIVGILTFISKIDITSKILKGDGNPADYCALYERS